MLQYDFEASAGYWICSAAHEMGRAINEELATQGITHRQWEVLAWLSFLQREMTQSELAEQMRIEAPTLVGVLDRMARDGWIERVPDPGDRRKKLIRVTDQVEPVWARMVQCATRVRAKATAGLSPEQLTQLRETLAHIRANLAGEPSESCPALGERQGGPSSGELEN